MRLEIVCIVIERDSNDSQQNTSRAVDVYSNSIVTVVWTRDGELFQLYLHRHRHTHIHTRVQIRKRNSLALYNNIETNEMKRSNCIVRREYEINMRMRT